MTRSSTVICGRCCLNSDTASAPPVAVITSWVGLRIRRSRSQISHSSSATRILAMLTPLDGSSVPPNYSRQICAILAGDVPLEEVNVKWLYFNHLLRRDTRLFLSDSWVRDLQLTLELDRPSGSALEGHDGGSLARDHDRGEKSAQVVTGHLLSEAGD